MSAPIPTEDPVTMSLDVLRATIDAAADAMLGIDNGGTWTTFTCTEIEALAEVFLVGGRQDVAEFIINEHGEGDEEGDSHVTA